MSVWLWTLQWVCLMHFCKWRWSKMWHGCVTAPLWLLSKSSLIGCAANPTYFLTLLLILCGKQSCMCTWLCSINYLTWFNLWHADDCFEPHKISSVLCVCWFCILSFFPSFARLCPSDYFCLLLVCLVPTLVKSETAQLQSLLQCSLVVRS